MNNPNPNMNMPNPNANVPTGYTAPQTLPVIVLDNIAQAGNYPVNPGSSTIFMNFAMTEMRMRSRDMSGFPMENMYDEAKTDHERQKIDTAIRMIRQNN